MPRARHACWAALALAATLAGGCRRPPEEPAAEITPTVEETAAAAATPEPKPEPLPAGRHALIASPPVTAADLDRLLNVGFTPDEVLAEVARRGVLRRPDTGERAHILTLPRGERLLDAMEAPGNLLSANALILYGQYPAGLPNPQQYRTNQNTLASNYAYAMQAQGRASSLHDQQAAEYQRRSDDLARRIATLKKRRTTMQQRGEMIATITLEIDRLEREAAALGTPP